MTYRPTALHQGPGDSCIIDGLWLGWVNCSCVATAIAIDRATHGAKRPTGCDIRRKTGDTIGGTSLIQTGSVAAQYGVDVELHLGGNTASPDYLAQRLQHEGAVIQGGTAPTLNTSHRSTGTGINHAVYVNEGRGWNNGIPSEVLVYDPAADGRRAGIASSPDWWPFGLLLRFAAALQPWGEQDPRTLGPGKVYAGFVHDPRPTITYRWGARPVKPSPDRTLADPPAGHGIAVRTGPSQTSKLVRRLGHRQLFLAYQTTERAGIKGSTDKTWFGNVDGTEWVHASGLISIGGAS